MKKILQLPLHIQIFIAMALGVGVGVLFQLAEVSSASLLFEILTMPGVLFIRALRMVIVPLIFTSIIVGIAHLSGGDTLRRMGLKAVVYYVFSSLLAILTGLFLTNLIAPGVGVEMPVSTTIAVEDLNTPASLTDLLVRLIPLNPLKAMVEDDILGVIFFGIILGAAMLGLPKDLKTRVSSAIEVLFDLIMKITHTIIALAPIGVFGLLVKTAATSDISLIAGISKYFATIAIGVSLHGFVVLPLVFYLFTRVNPHKHFKAMFPALATAFSTSSSSATLPVTMECLQENAGVSQSTTSFVIPLGATINMDGTALYECAGVLFIGQALGIDLSLTEQITVVITALLASIGAAGIPSAGLVMIFIVTKAVGFNDADVALLVGVMLAIDRPLDMLRTAVNVFSDSIGTVLIAHSEGEKNLYGEGK